MTIRRALKRLLDHDLPQIREAELAVVVLTRTTSGPCDVYQADIERLMGQGQFDDVPIGKIVLDEPSAIDTVRAELGIGDVLDVPVTMLYRHGMLIEQLRTTRACQLIERLRSIEQAGANPGRVDHDAVARDEERE
jgi:hypothetical protein